MCVWPPRAHSIGYFFLIPALACLLTACGPSEEARRSADAEKRAGDLRKKVVQLQREKQQLEQKQKEEIDKQKDTLAKKVIQLEAERVLVESKKDRVKRAIREVNQLAEAVRSYATDYPHFPDMYLKGAQIHHGRLFCTLSDIACLISPDYVQRFNSLDPWGQPYLYWCAPNRDHFIIMSAGEDGLVQESEKVIDRITFHYDISRQAPPITEPCFECDIIWFDDCLIQYPQGELKNCNESKGGA